MGGGDFLARAAQDAAEEYRAAAEPGGSAAKIWSCGRAGILCALWMEGERCAFAAEDGSAIQAVEMGNAACCDAAGIEREARIAALVGRVLV